MVRVRLALGEEPFAARWADGRQLAVAEAVSEALDEGSPSATAAPVRLRTDPLTSREHEVAGLVARGLSNRQIAAQLVISEGTVHRHVANILDKLHVTSRAQIAAWVVQSTLARGQTTGD